MDLLNELRRLHRMGTVNDEEFLVLKRMLAAGSGSAETLDRFQKLFMTTSKPTGQTDKRSSERRLPESGSSE